MNQPTGPVVVKIGGSTLGAHDTSLGDCARLHAEGWPIVVVHGGGATVSAWLQRMAVEAEFIDGLRKTTPESRDVVVAVLAGLVNRQLVQQLQRAGARAVGLSGVDAGLVRSPITARGLGLVGDDPTADPAILRTVLDAGYLPVVAPVGTTPDADEILNINADSAAGAIAEALPASALLFLTDVPGILDHERQLVAELDATRADALHADGTIIGGMLPKVAACRRAAAAGATARIVDGRVAGSIPDALSGALGTLVHA